MLVITGTGRAGSTVIALWLKELGLLPYEGVEIVERFKSGLEPKDVKRVNSAIWVGNDMAMQSIAAQQNAIEDIDYSIVKDNMFFYGNVLDTWLSVRKDLKFLVTVRNLNQVEKSRRNVGQLNQIRTVQEMQSDFGKFMSQVVLNELPYETICFPNFLENFDTLYDAITRLEPSLNISRKKGLAAWEKVVNKNLAVF